MPDGNPLIAQERSTTTAITGIGIAEAAQGLAHGVSNGDWVEAGLSAAGVGLEVLSMVIDPLGTLASYGVSWLIEHVRPLKEALDWFAGDPPVITSFSETWANVATEVNAVAQEFLNEVNAGTSGWSGDGRRRLPAALRGGLRRRGRRGRARRRHLRRRDDHGRGRGVRPRVRPRHGRRAGRPAHRRGRSRSPPRSGSRRPSWSPRPPPPSPRWRAGSPTWSASWSRRSATSARASARSSASSTRSSASSPSSCARADGCTTPSAARHADGSTPHVDGSTDAVERDHLPGHDPGRHAQPGHHDEQPRPTPGSTGHLTGQLRHAGRRPTPGGRPGDGTPMRDNVDPHEARPADARCTGGDPVDLATGEMLMAETDVELPGMLPLVLSARTTLGLPVSAARSAAPGRPHWTKAGGGRGRRLVRRARRRAAGLSGGAGRRLAGAARERRALAAGADRGTASTASPTSKPVWCATSRPATGDRRCDRARSPTATATASTSSATRTAAERACGTPAATGSASTRDGRQVTALRLLTGPGSDIPLVRLRLRRSGPAHRGRQLVRPADAVRLRRGRPGRRAGPTATATGTPTSTTTHGRCVRTEGTGGALTCTIDYDTDRRITTFTDSLGQVSRYHFNEAWQLVREIIHSGTSTPSSGTATTTSSRTPTRSARSPGTRYDEAGNMARRRAAGRQPRPPRSTTSSARPPRSSTRTARSGATPTTRRQPRPRSPTRPAPRHGSPTTSSVTSPRPPTRSARRREW